VKFNIRGRPDKRASPTWGEFKSAIRLVDRDSLLVQAAAATATIARDGIPDGWARLGMSAWNIADVARTAIAWGGFQRPEANIETLGRLCNLNVQLADESASTDADSRETLVRIITRLFFQQFPGQRSALAEVARTILLFGSAAEYPQGFVPEAMSQGWFEALSGGLTIDDYVGSVFLVSVGAQNNSGGFSLEWLDGPQFQELEGVVSPDALRLTFTEHLLTTASEFKTTNRRFQDLLPPPQKRFAFNPLADKPFIGGIGTIPIAPWVQAIIAKAFPPAVYHLALPSLGEGFTHDLGKVFQHYVGRQLDLVEGQRQVHPEVRYGSRRARTDSCDWFLDLPGLLVLIECKARQPVESLRTGGTEWLDSVVGSIGKGITQLNRSNRDIPSLRAEGLQIDATKPRVGLMVTLEPFYLNQNRFLREELPKAEFPIGVVSVSELESLVVLSAEELSLIFRKASDSSRENEMLLASPLAADDDRENTLLVSTWESIGLFGRVAEWTDQRAAK